MLVHIIRQTFCVGVETQMHMFDIQLAPAAEIGLFHPDYN